MEVVTGARPNQPGLPVYQGKRNSMEFRPKCYFVQQMPIRRYREKVDI